MNCLKIAAAFILGVGISATQVFADTQISCTSLGLIGHYGYSVSVRIDAKGIGDAVVSPLDISGASRRIKLSVKRMRPVENSIAFVLKGTDTLLTLNVWNEFDGEFYPGSLSGKFEGQGVSEELTCEGEDPALSRNLSE